MHGAKNSTCLCMDVTCELALILSQIPLKRARAEFHIDTKNKTIGAEIADEMIQI